MTVGQKLKKSSADNTDQRHPVKYAHRLLSICSLHCLFALARVLGWIVSRTPNQISRQARANIELCFPELTPTRQRVLVRHSIHPTCCSLLELAFLWHHPVEQVLQRIDIDWIDPGFSNDQSAKIIIAPHQGSWELLNYWLAQATENSFLAIYKPATSQRLNNYIRHHRSRTGARLVPTTTAGMRKLLKALKQQASCMILPDQRPKRGTAQAVAPFFSYPARTSLLVKNLVQRSDAKVYIATATRELEKGRYKIRVEALDREQIAQDDTASAAYLNHAIEQLVRQEISQYQWSYRRFDKDIYPPRSSD